MFAIYEALGRAIEQIAREAYEEAERTGIWGKPQSDRLRPLEEFWWALTPNPTPPIDAEEAFRGLDPLDPDAIDFDCGCV